MVRRLETVGAAAPSGNPRRVSPDRQFSTQADATLRMHSALLRAGRFFASMTDDRVYLVLAQSHRHAAAQLADIAADLHALGYLDEWALPRNAKKAAKRAPEKQWRGKQALVRRNG